MKNLFCDVYTFICLFIYNLRWFGRTSEDWFILGCVWDGTPAFLIQSECDTGCSGHGICGIGVFNIHFYCICREGFTGARCEKATSTVPTTAEATATSLHPSITVTTLKSSKSFRMCDKNKILRNIAKSKSVEKNTTVCHSGSHVSPEAFVMDTCDLTPHISSWQQGLKVQDTCQGTATLPTYSPVGIFVNGRYVSNLQGGIAGIFLGCENGGFKLALQHCNSIPTIQDVNGTALTTDPKLYYAIV